MENLYESRHLTGHVELNPNPILRTFHLLGWLFGHPSAWRSYIAEVAPDLPSNFCLLELRPHHWRNPVLREIFISTFLVLPILTTLISFSWLLLTGQPQADLIRGVILSYIYCLGTLILFSLVNSVAVGLYFSLVIGLFISIPDSMGGILWAVLLASGLGGQIAAIVAPIRPTRSPQARLFGMSVGVVTIILLILAGYAIVSGAFIGADDTAQLGEGITLITALAFGIGSGIIGGTGFALITRVRLGSWRTALQVGWAVALLCTIGYTGSIGISHTNLVIHFFGGTTGALLFSALFLLPYTMVERAGGPWAGAVSGAFACGMAWLPIYDYVIFENTSRNILMEIPYGYFWIVAILLAGLTVHYWLPVLVYPFQMVWNQLIFERDRQTLPYQKPALLKNSVFWDEFQFLPLYGLDKHLVLVIEHFPAEAQHALRIINASRQRWAAQAAQIELDARGLESYQDLGAIADAHHDLTTSSTLASPTSVILNMFRLISQDIKVALNHTSTFHRRLGLKAVEERLNGFLRDLTRSKDPHAARFYQVATQWRSILSTYLAELEKAVEDAQEIDNPYIVGVPLTLHQRIFVGRSDIALRLEQWLSDQRCPPLFLYGQRRMGKTSLLLNLGRLLHGGILPLFVDGQFVASGENYREVMANTTRECERSARRMRNIQLPILEQQNLIDDYMLKFSDWLDGIEKVLEQNGYSSALLAVDEFDALYNAAQRGHFNELDFLNLLRYLVQHRPRFKVLLTSARTPENFEDWASHLINLQVIHLGPLKTEEARQLVEHPTQDFSLAYEPAASQRVIELSACHPYLLQLLCYEIVVLKNSQPLAQRHTASLADVEASIEPALRSGQFFFEDLQRQGIDDTGRLILKRLATEGEGACVPAGRLQLQDGAISAGQIQLMLQRELLEEVQAGSYRFKIELVRRWFTR